MAKRKKFLLLFKGQIREDQSVHSNLAAVPDESFSTIGIHHIGVGHENHRNKNIAPQISYQFKHLIRRDASLQCPQIGALNGGAFRCRV